MYRPAGRLAAAAAAGAAQKWPFREAVLRLFSVCRLAGRRLLRWAGPPRLSRVKGLGAGRRGRVLVLEAARWAGLAGADPRDPSTGWRALPGRAVDFRLISGVSRVVRLPFN